MNTRAMNALMIIGLSTVLSSPLALAQAGMGQESGTMQRMYDPTTVQTLSGEVASVDTIAGAGHMAGGVHIVVKTDTSSVTVHLGPSWYLDSQAVKIAKRDKITVTGSRVVSEGKPALIASEVKKGDSTLKLRDKNGVPLWSRWQK